ncbi:MAG: NAD(P)/FAD-dependent oxidoreductase [Mycobacteriales bacterium]
MQGADPGPPVVVIGAGPAGLTAAYELVRRARAVTVVEGDSVVGGISRTAERDGWRFDIGGHRFFTKVAQVEALWHEILPPEEFLRRPRMSRIFYNGQLFDYPLRPLNALRGLGFREALRCVLSYLGARLRPPRDQSTFEGWVSARFGYRLYRIFFKTYTEKVWGVPATEIEADWAAQRIKNLSLRSAVLHGLLPRRKSTKFTSLIEEFQYPRTGPGQMWDTCADQVRAAGGKLVLETKVRTVHWEPGLGVTGVTAVVTGGYGPGAGAPARHRPDVGAERHFPAQHVISTMALPSLVAALDPAPPARVLEAARRLRFRDFLTVALVVPASAGFPDNWIYVHAPQVRLGRIQNFGSWSPYLVKEGRTCLGLEYFVTVGDDLWTMPDDELVEFGVKELAALGLVPTDQVERGYVVRMPKAYPMYDPGYQTHVQTIRDWLGAHLPSVQPVGRNGMHKYNNQDHSMLTAMLAVENICDGTNHDVWAVNVDDDYQEELAR